MGLGAGIMRLYDVINPNKTPVIGEIKNFFMLLEVYGSWTEPYIPMTSQVDDYDSPLKDYSNS